MTEPTPMFKSCRVDPSALDLTAGMRAKPPTLVLTAAMQRDAFQVDLADAQRRRDMRDYHRIEQEARKLTLSILGRKHA